MTLDRIVEVLWPAGAPRDPAANVATLVSRARRTVGEVIVAQGRSYALDPRRCSVDLDEAEALATEGERRSAAGESALAGTALRRALELLGHPPALPDEPEQDWVDRVRREADALRRRVRHALAEVGTHLRPDEAAAVAGDAVAADPYDERAVRDRMRALAADGSVAAALDAYQDLVTRLRDDLGIDPTEPTAALHLALLRGDELPAEGSAPPRTGPGPTLVGREEEMAALDRLWSRTCGGHGQLLLVDGEGGIGKSRVLEATRELVELSGGRVLRGRCHPAERSLFLQPFVEALRPLLLALPRGELTDLVGGYGGPLAALLPELTELVETHPQPVSTPAVERRRTYDAVVMLVRRLSLRGPVLLSLDDLQDGGAATIDLLGHLASRVTTDPVLLVGAVRSEAVETIHRLADRATARISLGALPRGAVEALAAAAGLGDRAGEVMTRTAGHTLSVVESLRALAAGETGVPESLAAVVLARVATLEDLPRDLVQGAAVLGGRLDPRRLADLVGCDELAAARQCEDLALRGLLHRAGAHYEFGNDLAQECVYRSLAPALAAAYHRRAADLFGDQPEAMAEHALAAGEVTRAAQGWLLAGQRAMQRSAVEDAVELLDRALAVDPGPALRARVLLARARAHEANTVWSSALADIDEALTLARVAGDRRLEMAALRERGGDVPAALRRPMPEWRAHLEAGLHLATGLGDRAAEADFTTRLVVLEASRLHLRGALSRAEASLARARASASQEAVTLALDGVKTALSYLGDGPRLREVTDELVPRLRGPGSTWLLQWAVFESSFAVAAVGDWDAARALVGEALEVNRRSGFSAYAGYFRAHLGWFERLTGDLEAAESLGRAAVAETSPVDHPWWYAAASGLLAGTLLESGARAEAGDLAARGLAAAGSRSTESWRLRCLAPLAVAADGPAGDAAYAEGRSLLEAIDCPPEQAWVIGADCYLLLARAAASRGDTAGAAELLAPLGAAVRLAWAPVRALVDDLAQNTSATS